MKKYFSYLNSIGKENIQFTFNNKYYFPTSIGGCCTLILYFCLIIYILYNTVTIILAESINLSSSTSYNYFDNENITIQSSIMNSTIPFTEEKIKYDDDKYSLFMAFQFKFKNQTTVQEDIEKYFKVTVENINDYQKISYSKSLIKCNSIINLKEATDLEIEDFDSQYCLEDFNLYKKTNKSHKQYLQISFSKCQQNCFSDEKIEELLNLGMVYLNYQKFMYDVNRDNGLFNRLSNKQSVLVIKNNSFVYETQERFKTNEFLKTYIDNSYTYLEKNNSKFFFVELDFAVYFKNPSIKSDSYLFKDEYSMKHLNLQTVLERRKIYNGNLVTYRIDLLGDRQVYVFESVGKIYTIAKLGGLMISIYLIIYCLTNYYFKFQLKLKQINKFYMALSPNNEVFCNDIKFLIEENEDISFDRYIERLYNKLVVDFMNRDSTIKREESDTTSLLNEKLVTKTTDNIKNKKNIKNYLKNKRLTSILNFKSENLFEDIIDIDVLSPITNKPIKLATKMKELNNYGFKKSSVLSTVNTGGTGEIIIKRNEKKSYQRKSNKKLSKKSSIIGSIINNYNEDDGENLLLDGDLDDSFNMEEEMRRKYGTRKAKTKIKELSHKVKKVDNDYFDSNKNADKNYEDFNINEDDDIYISLEKRNFEFFQQKENFFFKDNEISNINKSSFLDLYFTISRIENMFNFDRKERIKRILQLDHKILNNELVLEKDNIDKMVSLKNKTDINIINEHVNLNNAELEEVNFYKEFFSNKARTVQYYFNKCLFDIFKFKKYKPLHFSFIDIIVKMLCLSCFRLCFSKYKSIVEEKKKFITRMRKLKNAVENSNENLDYKNTFNVDIKLDIENNQNLEFDQRKSSIENLTKNKNLNVINPYSNPNSRNNKEQCDWEKVHYDNLENTNSKSCSFLFNYFNRLYKKSELYDVCSEILNQELDIVNILEQIINFKRFEFILFDKTESNLHKILPTEYVENSNNNKKGHHVEDSNKNFYMFSNFSKLLTKKPSSNYLFDKHRSFTTKRGQKRDNYIEPDLNDNGENYNEEFKLEEEKKYERNIFMIKHIVRKIKKHKYLDYEQLHNFEKLLLTKNILSTIFNKDYFKNSDIRILMELGISSHDIKRIMEHIKIHQIRLFTLEHNFFLEKTKLIKERKSLDYIKELEKQLERVNIILEDYISKYKNNTEQIDDNYYIEKIREFKIEREKITDSIDKYHKENKNLINDNYKEIYDEIIEELQDKYYHNKYLQKKNDFEVLEEEREVNLQTREHRIKELEEEAKENTNDVIQNDKENKFNFDDDLYKSNNSNITSTYIENNNEEKLDYDKMNQIWDQKSKDKMYSDEEGKVSINNNNNVIQFKDNSNKLIIKQGSNNKSIDSEDDSSSQNYYKYTFKAKTGDLKNIVDTSSLSESASENNKNIADNNITNKHKLDRLNSYKSNKNTNLNIASKKILFNADSNMMQSFYSEAESPSFNNNIDNNINNNYNINPHYIDITNSDMSKFLDETFTNKYYSILKETNINNKESDDIYKSNTISNDLKNEAKINTENNKLSIKELNNNYTKNLLEKQENSDDEGIIYSKNIKKSNLIEDNKDDNKASSPPKKSIMKNNNLQGKVNKPKIVEENYDFGFSSENNIYDNKTKKKKFYSVSKSSSSNNNYNKKKSKIDDDIEDSNINEEDVTF